MEWITTPEAWVALATLTLLEVVLGIDNIVFISILADRLPAQQQPRARRVGLLLAMGTRILLLLSITWIMRLTAPLFALLGHEVSGRDLVLMAGGMFLLSKATREIHHKLEGEDAGERHGRQVSFFAVLVQIALLDMVFSLDSVITAVGMAEDVGVMITAVVLSVGVMMVSAEPLGSFVSKHPTVKMLALSFLLLIGTTLVAEGAGFHIPKGYIYFAMGFSVLVEAFNLKAHGGKKAPPGLADPG